MEISAEILNARKSLKARIERHLRIYGLQVSSLEWTIMDPILVFKSGSIRRDSKAQEQNG
jgi:hypothetical protein